jgi:hypothetical protein
MIMLDRVRSALQHARGSAGHQRDLTQRRRGAQVAWQAGERVVLMVGGEDYVDEHGVKALGTIAQACDDGASPLVPVHMLSWGTTYHAINAPSMIRRFDEATDGPWPQGVMTLEEAAEI